MVGLVADDGSREEEELEDEWRSRVPSNDELGEVLMARSFKCCRISVESKINSIIFPHMVT